jgi:hypothetical protein
VTWFDAARHWLNVELWGPVWPNLLASAICTGAVYLKLRAEQIAHREEIKRHVTALRKGEGGGTG